ncbi:nickel/cobalt transporter [Streptomyces sp. NPDC127038]|uniref:nickel/cobalt transporter n=1 Tax=Streptomyces sp. NPDC127038 TaxID=3347114 RepID=UPI00365F13D3
MNHALRRTTLALASTALAVAGGLTPAEAAPAHPLGNFTVNYHTGLSLRPDRVDATVIVDRAEISTLQEREVVDADHDGAVSAAESRAYSHDSCPALGRRLRTTAGGKALVWEAVSAGLTYEPGQAGLKTSRLTCTFTAPTDLSRPADVDIHTSYDSRRIGWREMTVTGHGLRIGGTDLPSVSPTDELRHYPRDPAASPLNQRAAHLRTTPGGNDTASVGTTVTTGAGWFDRILAKTSSVFDSLVGSRQLTVPIGLLALLLALILGASHAVLPGHGKTIMASYLAGRRGTRRDAVTVGATVTLTHTAGVLVLGLALPAATDLAGEAVLTWLGAASGLIVTSIGLWLLASALRNRPRNHHHHHGPDHSHHHGHGHDGHPRHEHGLGEPLPRTPTPQQDVGVGVATLVRATETPSATPSHHPHEHGHHHGHDHGHHHHALDHHAAGRTGRSGLIGMGIAGGLVPSPSALVVLLGAVALGRTAFGVLLVIAYGLGMAGTLTAVGLLLVRLQEHLETRMRAVSESRRRALRRLSRLAPVATALLVVLVGAGLTVRALAMTT